MVEGNAGLFCAGHAQGQDFGFHLVGSKNRLKVLEQGVVGTP